MKEASVQDVWRSLRKATRRKLATIEFGWAGVKRLSDGDVLFGTPVVAICGENGAGKTSLLHALLFALVPKDRRTEAAPFLRAESGEVTKIKILDSSGDSLVEIAGLAAVRQVMAPAELPVRVTLFDPAMHLPAVLQKITGDSAFSDILEGLTPHEMTRDEIAEIGYVLGRDYASIRVFEIDAYIEIGVFPYFEVECGGVRYTSEEMGFGEHSVLTMLWRLRRLEAGCVLLLEEPETYVSARSQRCLSNLIAKYALEADAMVIVSTHSPKLIENFKLAEMQLLTRTGLQVSISAPPEAFDMTTRLEMLSDHQLVIFVEDENARYQSEALLRLVVPPGVAWSVIQMKGAGDVSRSLQLLPFVPSLNARFIGMFDGDQRQNLPKSGHLELVLPGENPEEFVKSTIDRLGTKNAAELFGIAEERLANGLAVSQGRELHDWIHEFSRSADISVQELLKRCVKSWSKHDVERLSALRGQVAKYSLT